jgi:hypothetical protein
MGFERVIKRIASDPTFASKIASDPKTTLKKSKINLSLTEFIALESVIEKLGILDLPSLGTSRLIERFSAHLMTWY